VKRILYIASIPVVAGAIYGWLVVQAVKDAQHILARKLWPGPPIDHP
jgi:hypothetical protein